MLRAVPKDRKKFDTNSEPLLEVTWEGTLCLENTQRTNKCDGVVSRDKDCLLGEPVYYDQDSVKPGG